MQFKLPHLFLGAVALCVGSTNAIGDCDNGAWNPANVQWTGGKGGIPYCATKHKSGIVISGVEVWASSKAVEAIQFYYSDGTNSPQFGIVDKNEKHSRLDWDPAVDSLSQVKTWGNGRGKYLGRLFIRTKKGAELDVGKNTNGQDTFEHNVESGILLGAFGKSGDVIDSLGLLFLRSKIDRMSVSGIEFKETPEELNKRMEGLETVTLDYADHTNNHPDANETFTFGKTETRSTVKKYSTTATHSFGISTAFEVGGNLFGIGVTSTTTLSYGYSNAKTEESSSEKSVTLSYSVATDLKPGQRVFCRATAMKGQYDGEYTSTVNILLEDGTTYSFAQEGTMQQVNWSQASSICQDKPFIDNSTIPTKRAIKFLA